MSVEGLKRGVCCRHIFAGDCSPRLSWNHPKPAMVLGGGGVACLGEWGGG